MRHRLFQYIGIIILLSTIFCGSANAEMLKFKFRRKYPANVSAYAVQIVKDGGAPAVEFDFVMYAADRMPSMAQIQIADKVFLQGNIPNLGPCINENCRAEIYIKDGTVFAKLPRSNGPDFEIAVAKTSASGEEEGDAPVYFTLGFHPKPYAEKNTNSIFEHYFSNPHTSDYTWLGYLVLEAN